MASVLKVDKFDPQSGTALEIGTSGDTVTVPTGAGLTVTDEVKTNKVSPATGTAFSLGDSGDTFTVPSGATLDISASTLTPPATMPASSGINFTALNASNIGSGTVPTARLGTGTASSSVFLRGDSSWVAAGGEANTPAFMAHANDQSGIVLATSTKSILQYEDLDTDGDFDNTTNYRFTPTTAGQYYIFAGLCSHNAGSTMNNTNCQIYFNGSGVITGAMSLNQTNEWYTGRCTCACILEFNGSSDYVELFGYIDGGAGTNYFIGAGASTIGSTWMGGYRVIT